MTFFEFNGLSIQKQREIVWNGVFLDVRADRKFNILLYDLGGFYVEVYHDPAQGKIVKLISYRSTKPLEPFLDQLSTGELDNLF